MKEDWNHTSGMIFYDGEYYNGNVYGASYLATPIVEVDGEEIECWTYKETKEGVNLPSWWGNGSELKNEFDINEK